MEKEENRMSKASYDDFELVSLIQDLSGDKSYGEKRDLVKEIFTVRDRRMTSEAYKELVEEREDKRRTRWAIGFPAFEANGPSLRWNDTEKKQFAEKHFDRVDMYGVAEAAAELSMSEINILNTETTQWGTRLLVEFKWWYGEKASEARWQKFTIRTDNSLPDEVMFRQVIEEIAAIRDKIEEKLGVPQDVRY